jgi:PAS domain S-box-containing protein
MSDREELQANERLRESEERFRLLVESVRDYAMVMLDANGIVTAWNLGAERVEGYRADEIIGRHVSQFYLEDEVRAGVCERELAQAAQAGRFECEGWRTRKDGSRFWANVVITAVRDPKTGDLLGFSNVTGDLTQRRLAEEALRESEERFRLTIDEAPIGMALVSLDGRFVRVNPAFSEVLGYDPAELTKLTFHEITHPEDLDTHLALAGQLARGEIPRCQFEKRYIRKDGTVVDTMLSVSIVRDAAGAPLYFISQIEDITERTRVDKELRDANAFLDAIVENIPLMLFIKESASLRFVRFNRAGEDLLGWPRQSLVGKSDFDFWPRDQAEFFVQKDRETVKRGDVVEIDEEPIQTRHQGVRILHTKKVPILDPSGNPLYLLGISEDITERRRIEKERRLLAEVNVALSASLDYDQTLATVTQLAVQSVADWCAIDLMEELGHIRRLKVASADPANAALCADLEQMPPNRDLPGFVRSVLEGRRSFVIEHVTSQYLESIAQGPEHLRALRAMGVTSLIGVPLLMRGEPLGVLLFGSSNPDRVYGQEDLPWAEALADRCAVAIENARLYRASVEATQRRDQMLGVVAHDLRNPLSTILMQTSVLRSGGRTPEPDRRSRKPFEVIDRAARRMNQLIQDLLDVSLIETGQLPIQRARLLGGELVVEAVETQKILATSSSVELRLEVGMGVPEVWGERDRLLQVFENLIGNAIKFTTPGGLITVGAASQDEDVVFWVADTGSGIAPDSLPHVFDRFWQATKGDRRGAGLGLPITKGIVEAHGGHIWVESTLGRGSTFFFSIPRAHQTADQPSGVSA